STPFRSMLLKSNKKAGGMDSEGLERLAAASNGTGCCRPDRPLRKQVWQTWPVKRQTMPCTHLRNGHRPEIDQENVQTRRLAPCGKRRVVLSALGSGWGRL